MKYSWIKNIYVRCFSWLSRLRVRYKKTGEKYYRIWTEKIASLRKEVVESALLGEVSSPKIIDFLFRCNDLNIGCKSIQAKTIHQGLDIR